MWRFNWAIKKYFLACLQNAAIIHWIIIHRLMSSSQSCREYLWYSFTFESREQFGMWDSSSSA